LPGGDEQWVILPAPELDELSEPGSLAANQ